MSSLDAGHRGAAGSIVHAHNPMRPVPAGFRSAGAVPAGREDDAIAGRAASLSWRSLFLAVRPVLKFWEKHGSEASARKADPRSASAGCWSARSYSDGLGAIYPPMMYIIMALDLLGYSARPSGSRRGRAPVRAAAGGRRRAVLLPALLLAGLGHGDRRVRPGRSRGTRPRRRCERPPTGC